MLFVREQLAIETISHVSQFKELVTREKLSIQSQTKNQRLFGTKFARYIKNKIKKYELRNSKLIKMKKWFTVFIVTGTTSRQERDKKYKIRTWES